MEEHWLSVRCPPIVASSRGFEDSPRADEAAALERASWHLQPCELCGGKADTGLFDARLSTSPGTSGVPEPFAVSLHSIRRR